MIETKKMNKLTQGIFSIIIACILVLPIALTAPFPVILVSIFLLYVLIYLTLVDLKSFRLPNHATLPLIAAGIGWHLIFAPMYLTVNAIIGAVAGYLTIWIIRLYYFKRRNVEAIGLGDAKFLAACGAWLGWQAIPLVLLTASLTALTVVTFQSFSGAKFDSKTAIPFGPYLCIGFWTIWSSKYVLY